MLPPFSFYQLQTRSGSEGLEVWDACRRKWLQLTPEEMVRQQLIQHLYQVCHVPLSLMSVEKSLKVGERLRRFDLCVWASDGSIWLLAECKAPEVLLSPSALSQALSYVSELGCRHLLLCNGHQNICWQMEATPQLQIEWPSFPKTKSPHR